MLPARPLRERVAARFVEMRALLRCDGDEPEAAARGEAQKDVVGVDGALLNDGVRQDEDGRRPWTQSARHRRQAGDEVPFPRPDALVAIPAAEVAARPDLAAVEVLRVEAEPAEPRRVV